LIRTAYHRAYYWSRLDARRASARASQARKRERRAIIKIICEAVTEARNDKPPIKGVDAAVGLPIRLGCEVSVEGSLKDDSSPVNHPNTPTYSGTLVGETTRRVTLNLHRGGQPVGARRIVGKRKWQPEQSGEK
jgi:hypothetical protein